MLEDVGWVVQELDLLAADGAWCVAVRQFSNTANPSGYPLYLHDRLPVLGTQGDDES